jgi:transposase
MSFVRRIKRNGRVYLAEVENRWVNGKVVQRHLRYVGREADGQTVVAASLSEAQVTQVKVYGPLLLLHHLAGDIGLPDALGQYSQEILSLVYAHCLDYESLNRMPQWFERTDLNLLLKMEGLTEKRLQAALDSLEGLDAEALQRKLFERLCRRHPIKPGGVIYDVTNTYLYGHSCPLAKPGHDKDGVRGRPLIQVGLSVTQDEGFPLFHKVFDGNVHDARTLQDLVNLFGTYDLPPGLFIYDRGIVSGRNVRDTNMLGWNTLCGIPLRDPLKAFWRPKLKATPLISLEHRHRVGSSVFYTQTAPYTLDGVKGELTLCLNEARQRLSRESRYDEVTEAEQQLAQGKVIKPGLERFFDRRGRLKQEVLSEAQAWDGCSCLFSPATLPVAQRLKLYFDKDVVEKAFRSLKGVTQLRPVRCWLANRVQAHVFICYLSYLLLSVLQYRLRDTDFSAERALAELGTVYKVYLRDAKNRFQLSRVVMLTKVQEQILKTIDPDLVKS